MATKRLIFRLIGESGTWDEYSFLTCMQLRKGTLSAHVLEIERELIELCEQDAWRYRR